MAAQSVSSSATRQGESSEPARPYSACRADARLCGLQIEEHSQFIGTTASELRKLSELERVYVDR